MEDHEGLYGLACRWHLASRPCAGTTEAWQLQAVGGTQKSIEGATTFKL